VADQWSDVRGKDAIVGIEGLRAMRRDIARMTDEYKGSFTVALKAAGRAVCDPIANKARETLPMSDRRDDKWHHSGRLVASVRVNANKMGASVAMGRAGTVTYAGWIEFGGKRHSPRFSERPIERQGRFLYPAAYELAPSAAARYNNALREAINAAVWTNETDNPQDVKD
jgi:hypothetical protein